MGGIDSTENEPLHKKKGLHLDLEMSKDRLKRWRKSKEKMEDKYNIFQTG